MNTLKKDLLTAAGLLACTFVLNMSQASQVMAQTAKDVVISNAASQPIPTTVQALPAITGNVAVTNTPEVSLQSGSTVGINPSSNTVRIGSVVSVTNADDAGR